MRQYLGLGIGLVVGIAGAILFQQSLPPETGSMEEKLEAAEMVIRRNERELSLYRAAGAPRHQRTVGAGLRSVVQDIRDGKDVSPDDVFWVMKPALRDLSPLLDRMRMVEQEDRFDSLAGHYAREYNLSEEGQAALKEWLEFRENENARAFHEVIHSEASGFVEFVQVMEMNDNSERGLDQFMETQLQGEELVAFKAERLEGRVNSVQHEANRRLHRLDEKVGLDEAQLDEMFAVMARGSKGYEPGMEFDGMGADTGRLEGVARDAAIREVLRADQLERYEAYQDERRAEAERELRRVGMTLPENWELLDDDNF